METIDQNRDEMAQNTERTAGSPMEISPDTEMVAFAKEVQETQRWLETDRFKETTRLYSARQVVEQRGTIQKDHTVARTAAVGFYKRLRELFAEKKSITTFGPYSPGQAVTLKRNGLEGIYLGGWATSAKGSISEDPGPDLASYPLSQVPDEAASIVRGLLTADKNQQFARARMTAEERHRTPKVDYRPFIIADADTGHGGEAQVRNLIQRFVEAGVPGYHIEDQKPGCKKCGHQAGKVLVPQDEQIQRLNAARLQLDIMKVPGLIVARTDAEAATFVDGCGDERDQPFILGATNIDLPPYKVAVLSVLRRFYQKGVTEINGHLLYQISESAYDRATVWLKKTGALQEIDGLLKAFQKNPQADLEITIDQAVSRIHESWEIEAKLKTFGEAVADVMEFHIEEGSEFEMTVAEWLYFAKRNSFQETKAKAKSLGINIIWDCEICRTPEGYYQIQCGIDYSAMKSIAVAPFCDILWMETKTADLADAKQFADAVHAVYPDKMLAYNLSPSFNWDTTGMTDEEMQQFPEELGKLGFVFNFITYGGHQIDGLAAEEFATALQQNGMLALARLQRKLRLLNSPYRTPQALAGGARVDGALMASSGRTASTRAMGKDSTHHQHLVQTEVPPRLLEQWLALWAAHNGIEEHLRVELRPYKTTPDLLELSVLDSSQTKVADVIFDSIQDRQGKNILSIRDQNTFDPAFRKKRLMSLLHLFLIHRYKSVSIHYVSPTEDNQYQTQKMKRQGLFKEVQNEIGEIIVVEVHTEAVKEFFNPDQVELKKLISKSKNLIN